MMAILPLVLALSSSPSPSPSSSPSSSSDHQVLVTLAVGTDDVQLRHAVDAAVAVRMSRLVGLDVVTVDDLRRRLNMEGERQGLGCDGDELDACLAELRNAMSIPWVLHVDVAVLDATAVVSLTLTDANGAVVGRAIKNTSAAGATLTADLAQPIAEVMRPLQLRLGLVSTGPWPMLQAVGGVSIVVGTAVTALGLLPLAAQSRATSALQSVRTGPGDLGSRLATANSLQKQQSEAAAAWNTTGLLATTVGAVVIVAGTSAIAAALIGAEP